MRIITARSIILAACVSIVAMTAPAVAQDRGRIGGSDLGVSRGLDSGVSRGLDSGVKRDLDSGVSRNLDSGERRGLDRGDTSRDVESRRARVDRNAPTGSIIPR